MEEDKPMIKTKNKLLKRKEEIQKRVVATELKETEYFLEGLVNGTKCH